MAGDQGEETAQAATCCGERYCGRRDPSRKGQPLVLACQLCPESPSYWRNQATQLPEPDAPPVRA